MKIFKIVYYFLITTNFSLPAPIPDPNPEPKPAPGVGKTILDWVKRENLSEKRNPTQTSHRGI